MNEWSEAVTPDSIKPHQDKYREGAWRDYSISELGSWVHLFVKRSQHRKDAAKKDKDLQDAQNYLDMIQSHINALRGGG